MYPRECRFIEKTQFGETQSGTLGTLAISIRAGTWAAPVLVGVIRLYIFLVIIVQDLARFPIFECFKPMILEILFYLLSLVLIVATILPLTRKDHWTFTVFEFPRLQKLFLSLITIAVGAYLFPHSTIVHILIGILIIIAFHLIYLIFPFTPFSRKTVPGTKKTGNSLKLMIANVFQPNQDYGKLIREMERIDPDVILLLEADEKWRQALQAYTDHYQYRIENPKDNTYGILLYSKKEIGMPEVRHLIDKKYPSLRLRLKLDNDKECVFYGLHPPPPSPTERTYSTARDNELAKVAKEVKQLNGVPCIVAGDLNDVAWSHSTDNFIEVSGLRDPRVGRGIFATFHARYFFMRWPLDHVFCSSHFKLVKMKRLKYMGSDHFPVFIEFSLD